MSGRPEPFWSGWADLAIDAGFSPRVLAEILDGGQAFRWHRQSEHTWIGAWAEHVAELRWEGLERLQWRGPAQAGAATGHALKEYLDAGRPAAALADLLPWRSDAHLARCLAAFPGLRILRQSFGETLLCFLCSAAKQILQIKQMAARLAEFHGPALFRLAPACGVKVSLLHRLPTWEELAGLSEGALRDCRLGFRARHIHRTAQFLAANRGWLARTASAPYAEARALLCQLPGVGEKIADCALLFGAGRLEAFPVDVWIHRAMVRHYGLNGWKPPQVAQFGRVHFGPLAGLAQQYLFAWERANPG